ncbi:SMC family ATPase [Bacillus sp. 165]|uniref:AAA family ATPase n=1 Tax=Bacillus sp. 165 TaxID=1529117 RepID=UPI001ADBE61E|nr:SMC family ATPase [Bacillus sp. 165]MBO9129289.1 SMC family ATPase [Bacillus sp. 165]
MRPLQLIMTAFGPYKNKEVIDFQELGEHRLFAVTGNTGAGKTTIFDAICYALFGEASGEERNDPQVLRSHFAADDLYTSVELTFKLRGKIYRIFRQMGHRKAGNKTVTGAAVEFFVQAETEEIPCVDRFHVTDVNKRVEVLLGLTKHQFSQIVMLPQGEFRKLLTSETENKEEILRRIFKTDRYKWMQEILDQRRKVLKSELQEKVTERDIYFRNVLQLPNRPGTALEQLTSQEKQNSYQMLQALAEELTYYKNEFHEIETKIQTDEQQRNEKESAFHHAKATNERLTELQHKEESKLKLKQQLPIIQHNELQLRLADKANEIVGAEEYYEQAQQLLIQRQQLADQKLVQIEKMKVELQQIKHEHEAETAKETEREKGKQKLRMLQDMQGIFERLHEQERRMTLLQTDEKQKKDELHLLIESIEQSKAERRSLQDDWQSLDQSTRIYLEKTDALRTMQEDYKLLQEYCRSWEQSESYRLQLQKKQADLQGIRTQYEQLEQAWLEGQAGMLALHLQDGTSCPVCGSMHHPNKAVQVYEIDKKELLSLKEKRDTTERESYQIEEAYKSRLQLCTEYALQMQQRGYSTAQAPVHKEKLLIEGKQLRAEVDLLKQKQETRSVVQQKLLTLETNLEKQQSQKDNLEHKLQTITLELTKLLTSYKHDKKQIPEDLSSLSVWQQECLAAEQDLSALEEAWRVIQVRYQEAVEASIREQTSYEHAHAEQQEAAGQAERAKQQFLAAMKQAEFETEQEYQKAKLPRTEYEAYQEQIQQYYTSLHILEERVTELHTLLQGKQWANLQQLQEELNQLNRLLDLQKEQKQKMKLSIERIAELERNIINIEERIQGQEKGYEQLVDLYEVIKGDNESRLSFERYILLEYLEQIVQAANTRLMKLSNGQFYLKRSERVEKRNRQSGLGLDVYDVYTGQTRDVKTLSGGEKFNASLCLALGMADVIQAYEGGVSIETMFIDEGFGSLDEESLTKAVDTLIELQKSGRLIGVISHVQELKNAMPAVLEVKKQKNGCSKTKFILK